MVENTIIDKFTEKGFEFVDHRVAAKEIKVTAGYKVQDLTADQARTLGNQADAEVVIVGKAIAKLQGEIGGGMKSAQADLSARAVRNRHRPGHCVRFDPRCGGAYQRNDRGK